LLKNTFCHIPGIGAKSERRLWAQGFRHWEDVVGAAAETLPLKNDYFLKNHITESMEQLTEGNSKFFSDKLPPAEQWRLFSEFRDSTAYLDIETSGMPGGGSYITTIAMYDGRRVFHYVKGQNLNRFLDDVSAYNLLVTYNGRCFDVPFIENYFRVRLPHAQIDLRYVLKSLGYTGGLKGCEKKLGIDRDGLEGVDGYAAVLLWEEYRRTRDQRVLETLLAYNVLDAVNLERLMVTSYNLKLQETPFLETHRLPDPREAVNPFEAHRPTVTRVKNLMWGFHG